MNRSNCTNLKQFEGGRVVKQGDSASLFGFELYDENWVPIDLDGQEATIHFVSKKAKRHSALLSKGQRYRLRFPRCYQSRAILSRLSATGTYSQVTRASELTWFNQRKSTSRQKWSSLVRSACAMRSQTILPDTLYKRTMMGH